MLQIRKKIEGAIAKAPFVYIVIPFMCGIAVQSTMQFQISIVSYGILLFVSALCILLYKLRKAMQIPLFAFWFLLFGIVTLHLHDNAYSPIVGQKTITAKISAPLQEKQKTYKTEITTYVDNLTSKAIVYLRKDSLSAQLEYGDIISLNAHFKPIENNRNSTFNYVAFNANKYVYSSVYLSSQTWRKVGEEQSVSRYSYRIQNYLLTLLENSGLQQRNFELLAALVFGNKSYLQQDTKQEFSTAGAMHILAVSGLHVGIIALILLHIIGFIPFRNTAILKSIMCCLGIWAYACITGLSPSVSRAACMFSLVCVSHILNRRVSVYNTLAAAACCMLIIEPRVLFEVGFQLSYAAVLGIIYFGNKIQNIVPRSSNIVWSYIWGIISVSIAVQITTLPITLYYFGFFPTYSICTNLFAIPLAFILLLGVIVYLIVFSVPLISEYIMYIIDFAASYLQHITYVFYQLPYAELQISLSQKGVCIMYVIIIICVTGIELYSFYRIQKNIGM